MRSVVRAHSCLPLLPLSRLRCAKLGKTPRETLDPIPPPGLLLEPPIFIERCELASIAKSSLRLRERAV
ncbi:MAG: hypothetical protein EBZ48_00260 [Proteobacteria bacterium]|nr:hypothetical protein [Pseudomonadota bacterium]